MPAVPKPHDLVRGACRDYPTELFFPERGDNSGVVRAKAICKTCEVREACLDFAMESNEKFGVWGGMSGKERRKERVRRARATAVGTTSNGAVL